MRLTSALGRGCVKTRRKVKPLVLTQPRLQADLAFRLKVPLGRRAMRAGQSREQRLGETGNGTAVDLVHRRRLGRVWRGSPAVIADAQHRAL